MKKKEFLKDVMHEIEQLKIHATEGEKNSLDFDNFRPTHPECCIYGQLTGECTTKRAHELMNKACKRVWHIESIENIEAKSFTGASTFLNGKYKEQMWEPHYRSYEFLSSLEGYITLKGAKNKEIISYIKGKIDTLEL